jgi:biopolymer transport protein ExbB
MAGSSLIISEPIQDHTLMGISSGRGVHGPWKNIVVGIVLAVFVVGALALTGPAARGQDEGNIPTEKKPGDETKKAKEAPNLFQHIIVSAGWFFGPLLFLVSIGLVTLIVLLAMDLRMGVAVPPAFVDEFTDLVNRRQFKQAFELCRTDNSFLARVLTAGMGRLQYGIEDSREASVNMVESIKANKDQLINYLGTIGTLGPMLGLVGTVFGMILSFMELSSGETPRPERLADGISHALVVTLLGIAISVPAIFCHAFFSNRLTRIAMDTSNLSDDLLTQMYHNSKRSAAPAAEATRTVTSATQAVEPKGA